MCITRKQALDGSIQQTLDDMGWVIQGDLGEHQIKRLPFFPKMNSIKMQQIVTFCCNKGLL
jgi:hypothetical protein